MRLALVGDVMLGRLVNETLRGRTPDYPWGDTRSIMQDADFRLCNLECAISDRGEPWEVTPKKFHFRSDPKNVAVLRAARMNAVALANNHVLDYGYDALIDTLELLDEGRVRHAGAGRNKDEAEQPAIASIQGMKVGVIAFTDNQPEWEARDGVGGIFYVPVDLQEPRAQRLIKIVGQTKTKVDILIISAHWGPNWGYEPPAEHVPFAHALIDAGADIVFGHSGHVFRGVELYRGRVILYCAGDFITDYAVDPIERNDQSFIFLMETNTHGIRRVKLYPTEIDQFQARLARELERQAIAEKMQLLLPRFKTPSVWKQERGYLEIKR